MRGSILTRRALGAATAVVALGVAQPALAADHGAVYTLANGAPNAVLAFDRAADGSLTAVGSTLTGGAGAGAGLGSQGALVEANGFLLAVNAGSNDVSVLRVRVGRLHVTDVEPSGGTRPVSIAVRGRLVYVLNAGGAGNVAGFRLDGRGALRPIAGSVQPLANADAGAAQVSITPDADALVVTEKATNTIDTFALTAGGRARPVVAHRSNGVTPFGFAFGRGDSLIVSEAAGGAPLASSVSSYAIGDGAFRTISAVVPTLQTAACWLITNESGDLAFTTNAGSDSVGTLAVANGGAVTLTHTETAGAGSHPTDLALTGNEDRLFTLDAFTHQISALRVGAGGSLTYLGRGAVLPASAVGLVAR
jgi:6-phosphogluconolactonase (cycloisomerase 2 family)